jgi:excisionase family DNA binding protein
MTWIDLRADPDRLFVVKEVAEYLRVSQSLIYDQIQKGAIPAFRVGTSRCLRLRAEDVIALEKAWLVVPALSATSVSGPVA